MFNRSKYNTSVDFLTARIQELEQQNKNLRYKLKRAIQPIEINVKRYRLK